MGIDEMVTRIARIIDPDAWKDYPADTVVGVTVLGERRLGQFTLKVPVMAERKRVAVEKAIEILNALCYPDPVRMIRVAARFDGVESFGIGDIWTAVMDDFLGVR